VTAEFAVALPAVILVVMALLGAVKLGADHAWLAGTAASVARAISLGSAPDKAMSELANLRPGLGSRVEMSTDAVCVTLSSAGSGILSLASLNAVETSCMPRAL